MIEKANKCTIIVCPTAKDHNSLKKFAELVILLNDKKDKKQEIITCINSLGVNCIGIDKYNSNNDIVKIIETGNGIHFNEREIMDSLENDIKIILYFRAYEMLRNRDLFAEEILCPFVLYREHFNNECMLVVLPDESRGKLGQTKDVIQEISNPISRYMYYESLRKQVEWQAAGSIGSEMSYVENADAKIDFQPVQNSNTYYNQCFLYVDGRVSRLVINFHGKIKNIVNVMPLLKLDHNSYAIFSQSVEECFGEAEKFREDWLEYDLFTKIGELFERFGIKTETTSRRSSKTKYRVTDPQLYEKYLMTIMIKSICMNSLRSMDNLPEKEDVRTVYKICGHMSLLAFLFFTSYCREIEKGDWTSWESSAVLRLVNLSEDYADGILQIIENAKEYADVGYLNYHIIEINATERAKLKTQYKEYFDRNEDIKFFLKIQIIDMGKSDIVSTFTANNISQDDQGNTKLLLEDFFLPLNESCKQEFSEYYKDTGNVIMHYGLRQFVSMVQAGKGYFEVSSTQKFKVDKESRHSNYKINLSDGKHIPGTEYKIFLPVQYAEKAEQKTIGFGAELDYNDAAVTKKWECKLIAYEQLISNKYHWDIANNQADKIGKIYMFAGDLMKEGDGRKRKILCIDVKSVSHMWQIEILTKALLLYIVESGKTQRIALYNATRSFMMNFTRYLCNFYNNIASIVPLKGVNDTQIYVCKDDYSIDLGFKGNSLVDAFMVCDYLARTRGVFNDCLELIQSMVPDAEMTNASKKPIKFAPFDLLIELENCCLFEERVRSDLQKDIQDVAFGCNLHDAHMKVGSKMHIIDNFFDATLIFASGYYTSRFAYLLSRKIALACGQAHEKLTLVGYENFSELLLTETRRLLNVIYQFKDVDYIIFEQGTQNDFKFLEDDLDRYADRKFIVIVPINCTLTTHSKIEAEIRNNIRQDAIVMMNLAVILIRSKKENTKIIDQEETTKEAEKVDKVETEDKPRGIESRYWTAVDTKNRVITTSITNPKEVYYNVLISNIWKNPLVCSACFPPADSLEKEKPMLTMSYTSVIPMVLIGLKKQYKVLRRKNEEIYNKIEELNCYSGNIDMLKDCMIYGHVENGSNHFEYYFETELLMKKIYEGAAGNTFSRWIEKLREVIKTYKYETQRELRCKEYIYDILVAPMNRTNATFVEYINMHAFENVPIIVYIDANREFRDNIKTKYSNLTALYNNLVESNKRAVVNFHFIDDCIISGTTFYRTKSLLQSLFPEEAFSRESDVYVDIFQNVILLLNRCSNSTKLNYAQADHFFSYIDVHISSMRTHHDKACVLCENESHYKLLRDCSSTNKMAEEWNRKLAKHTVKSIEESKEVYVKDERGSDMRNRHYRRLYCANHMSDELDRLGVEKNNTEKVKVQILAIINQRLTDTEEIDGLLENMEWIISYFKVTARPFIVFRKSVLEAIYIILIETIENWGKANGEESDIISKTISKSIEIVQSGKCDKQFLKSLESLYRSIISLLSSLGSKYLIRKQNYAKLIHNDPVLSAKDKHGLQHKITPFELFYAASIKRMITLNKDETVGLWFETLLVKGVEYGQERQQKEDRDFIKKYGIDSDFGKLLFLENTYIIFQTVALIYEKCNGMLRPEDIEKTMINFDDAYYYENYRNLTKHGRNKQINLANLREETKQMVLLFAHLKENVKDERDVNTYYTLLADRIKDVSGADEVLIYGCSQSKNKNDVYEIANQSMSTEEAKYKSTVDKMNEKATDILQENIIISKEDNYVVVKIDSNSEWLQTKYSDREEYDYSDNLFCFFKFNRMSEMDNYEILRRMRNILVFRHTMMERFRTDFNNNAFKVFMEQKHRNELIASNKAVSHTANEILSYVTQEMAYFDRNNKKVYAAYALQLAADSLVSRLYVKMIQGEVPEEVAHPYTFELTDQLLEIWGELRFYSDDDDITEGEYTGLSLKNKVDTPLIWKVPTTKKHYIMLLITAILYNVLQHGKSGEDRKIQVEISKKEKEGIHYLCFKNETRYPDEAMLDPKEESGITIKALEYYCDKYLGHKIQTHFSDERVYEIELPIYAERDV